MKQFLINILQKILKILARLTIAKYKPTIIGITGSVGKTSTKQAIACVIRENNSVRVTPGNFNNELGMPLTVLGPWKSIPSKSFWIKVIIKSFLNLLGRSKYPDFLVLEYGADKPGDIEYLLSIAKPDISIITAIGEIPAHMEFYQSKKDVVEEKANLVKALSNSGVAIFNYDDEDVRDMRVYTKAQNLSFGFSSKADLNISEFNYYKAGGVISGIKFKIARKENYINTKLKGVAGKSHAYAAAAAATVGLVLQHSPDSISEGLSKYRGEWGRMKLANGILNTTILNDAYNASPLSVENALDTLHDMPSKRKVAILGDMLELGKYSDDAHVKIGAFTPKYVDVLIAVGKKAKNISDSAKRSGMKRENVYHFNTTDEARIKIKKIIEEGDTILIKASRGMKFEKVLEVLVK